LQSNGHLKGRALTEALAGQKLPNRPRRRTAVSLPAANGKVTALDFQVFHGRSYFDEACFEKRSGANSHTMCVE
jgi:hypothetical protein